jgi:hypothetical protein
MPVQNRTDQAAPAGVAVDLPAAEEAVVVAVWVAVTVLLLTVANYPNR